MGLMVSCMGVTANLKKAESRVTKPTKRNRRTIVRKSTKPPVNKKSRSRSELNKPLPSQAVKIPLLQIRRMVVVI